MLFALHFSKIVVSFYVTRCLINTENTYINLSILPLNYIAEPHVVPLLAYAEGKLLYCNDRYCFRWPKRPIDFARAYVDAKFHYDTFCTIGSDLLEQVQDAFVEEHYVRLAAQFTAQAVVYFYHTCTLSTMTAVQLA